MSAGPAAFAGLLMLFYAIRGIFLLIGQLFKRKPATPPPVPPKAKSPAPTTDGTAGGSAESGKPPLTSAAGDVTKSALPAGDRSQSNAEQTLITTEDASVQKAVQEAPRATVESPPHDEIEAKSLTTFATDEPVALSELATPQPEVRQESGAGVNRATRIKKKTVVRKNIAVRKSNLVNDRRSALDRNRE